jgi:hypothetical protein
MARSGPVAVFLQDSDGETYIDEAIVAMSNAPTLELMPTSAGADIRKTDKSQERENTKSRQQKGKEGKAMERSMGPTRSAINKSSASSPSTT